MKITKEQLKKLIKEAVIREEESMSAKADRLEMMKELVSEGFNSLDEQLKKGAPIARWMLTVHETKGSDPRQFVLHDGMGSLPISFSQQAVSSMLNKVAKMIKSQWEEYEPKIHVERSEKGFRMFVEVEQDDLPDEEDRFGLFS